MNQYNVPGLTYHKILKSETISQVSNLLSRLNKYILLRPTGTSFNHHVQNKCQSIVSTLKRASFLLEVTSSEDDMSKTLLSGKLIFSSNAGKATQS